MSNIPLSERLPYASQKLDSLKKSISSVLKGQNDAIEMTTICFLSGGHLLIEDVPGVGKTTLATAFAHCLALPARRLQFTSDILPSDIVGVNIYDPSKNAFSFHEGPIFTNILLADEINRAEPRAQSALLEAMFERQVSVDGVTRKLPTPFMVIATQNPVDFSGTFPLPDSQLDRFQFRISLGYPDPQSEKSLLKRAVQEPLPKPVLDKNDINTLYIMIDNVRVSDEIIDDMLALVHATRNDPRIIQGASTRAMLDLRKCACARALLHARDFVLPDDLKALATPSLAHRVRLSPNTHINAVDILDELVKKTLG